MALLKSLGIDFTLWIHVGCFAVAYLSISNFIFKPYMKALSEREARTIGGEEQAALLMTEADSINHEYETKAKAVNASIRAEYEKNRLQAVKESETLLVAARADANALLEKSRTRIASEIATAKGRLSAEVPAITAAIASKMAGKEISL